MRTIGVRIDHPIDGFHDLGIIRECSTLDELEINQPEPTPYRWEMYTVVQNGVDTSITVLIRKEERSGIDTTHSIELYPGDKLGVRKTVSTHPDTGRPE